MFLTGFAALAVIPTLPAAARDLDGVALYPLVAGAFVAASLLGGVLGGGWADRAGARRPLAAGVALAVATLLISATSTSIWQLAAGRFLDGIAAGMIAVAINTAIGQAYPDHLRPRALALMSACWIVPSLAGPPLAGLVAEWWSWRTVFFGLAVLSLPPSLAVVALLRERGTGRAIPVVRSEAVTVIVRSEGALGSPEAGPARSEDATDATGSPEDAPVSPGAAAPAPAPLPSEDPPPRPALLVAAAVSLGAALGQYAASGWDLRHLLCGAAGLALLAVFVPRLLPPGTWRAARGLPATVLLRGLASGAYFTLEAFVPLLLDSSRRVPAVLTGLAFTGAAVAWAAASWAQGNPLARRPRHHLVAAGALVLAAAVGLAAAGTLPGMPALTAGSAMIVAAVGMGLLAPSLTLLSLAHSPPDRQGYASSAMQTAQNLGQVAVMALVSAAFNATQNAGSPALAAYATAFTLLLVPSTLAAALASRTRMA
ncbi:MFS transporter [Streptomyces sp. GMY02]|uniref:MFS transporter n=1 Tax=Streptomyces sp. GMY02 TaxID=1333528 RepID=UPI001C2BAD3C|nr:MFS transporter [Streptomyces sp. GMY02]QXE39259.1 MFS transporter [Streptomyces sp. GMY02]